MLPVMRTVVTSVMGGLVLVAFALWFVFDDRADMPDLLWLGIVLALGAAAAGLINRVGFHTPAVSPAATTDESAQQSRASFQAGTITRMAMAEMPAIAAIALAFVAQDGGYVLYLLGAVISLSLLAVYALPTDGTIARTQRSLEREGGSADLASALGR